MIFISTFVIVLVISLFVSNGMMLILAYFCESNEEDGIKGRKMRLVETGMSRALFPGDAFVSIAIALSLASILSGNANLGNVWLYAAWMIIAMVVTVIALRYWRDKIDEPNYFKHQKGKDLHAWKMIHSPSKIWHDLITMHYLLITTLIFVLPTLFYMSWTEHIAVQLIIIGCLVAYIICSIIDFKKGCDIYVLHSPYRRIRQSRKK